MYQNLMLDLNPKLIPKFNNSQAMKYVKTLQKNIIKQIITPNCGGNHRGTATTCDQMCIKLLGYVNNQFWKPRGL